MCAAEGLLPQQSPPTAGMRLAYITKTLKAQIVVLLTSPTPLPAATTPIPCKPRMAAVPVAPTRMTHTLGTANMASIRPSGPR